MNYVICLKEKCSQLAYGDIALIIALESQGFKENDEVIVPSFTIIFGCTSNC